MRKVLIGWVRVASAAAVIAGFASGCANDKGNLNTVQPGYVTKSELLDKSWYYRRTVVDAPETVGPYMTIGTGDLFTVERIRFAIEEDYLVAYRDYEYIPGSETGEWAGSDYYGTPVVAFPITSHFDIARGYNAATGEATNVIAENQSDRVWYERDYMRVAWNATLLTGDPWVFPIEYLDANMDAGGDLYYHEDDLTNPWRARITPSKGFLDFVTKHQTVADPATCYYDYDLDPYVCGGGEIRVRHAFTQVDDAVNEGYDALYYPDTVALTDNNGREIRDPSTGEVVREPVFERFGYYRLERLTYDDERGLTESGRQFRVLRFDIWDRSVDAQGNVIPYASRKVKPIVYYLNYDFPADLVAAATEVATEWNETFKATVASLQNKSVSQVPNVFELRLNSCSATGLDSYFSSTKGGEKLRNRVADAVNAAITDETLDNWCAATEYLSKDSETPFTWQQMGDSRYNMLYWIPNVVPAAFSGYGPMLADPTNGRIVTATAYILGYTIDEAATRALQYIDYMNGELTLEQLLSGADVPSLVTAQGSKYDPRRFTHALEEAPMRAQKLAAPEHMDSLKKRFASLGGAEELMKPLDNGNHFDERLARVAGTSLEAEYLTRPEDLMLASRGEWRPGMEVSNELLQQASRLNRMRDNRSRRQVAERKWGEHTFCNFAAELDNGLVGLAKELKGLPRNERRKALRERIFKAVSLHEVGHNVGLRHNFEGSYDALNYPKQFWELESAGLSDQDKLEAKQPEFMYSSIMDYHGKINADFQGLGMYDKAAVKFGYGQLVEEFVNTNAAGGKALRDWRFLNDYKKLPQHVGSVNSMYDRRDVQWNWNEEQNRRQTTVQSLLGAEVPYMFCSDEYAGYTPTCKRFDFGANQREEIEANVIRYKNYFIFSNYLRNRLVLDFGALVNRGDSIFHDIVMTYQYFYLYYRQFGGNEFLDSDLGKDMATAVANGFNLFTEVLAMPEPSTYYKCNDDRGTPANPADDQQIYYSGGWINYDPLVDVDRGTGPDGENCNMDTEAYVGLGDAQPLFLGFSEDYVDWTFTYLGTYWDKESAIMNLTYPAATFFRVNGYEDYRNFSVSPYRLYSREILQLMNGLIRYDRKALASQLDDAQVDVKVVPRAILDPSAPLQDIEMPAEPAPTNLPIIVPSFARNLQRFAVLYGSALLTSPLDDSLDFGKHTRIWVKGAFDEIVPNAADWNTLVAGNKATECTLPNVGTTYRATKVADGYNIGFDMVSECASLSTKLATARVELANAISANDEDAEDEARFKVNNLEFDLGVSQQMLQYTRLVHSIYEHGAEL